MLTEAQLRQRLYDVLAVKGVGLDQDDLHRKVREFLYIANALKMRDSDEIFSFLITLEAYNLLGFENLAEVEKIFADVRDNALKGLENYTRKAEVDMREKISRLMDEQIQRLTDKVAELSDKSAMAAAVRNIGLWVMMIVSLFVIAFSLVSGVLYMKGVDSGDARGYARGRDEALILKKRDAFWTSKTGMYLQKMHDDGVLEDRLKLWDSPAGQHVEKLYAEGKLDKRLRFAQSSGGQLAAEYSQDTLIDLLQCKMKGWRVEKRGEQRICWPKSGAGFYVPDTVVIPELDGQAKKKK